MNISTEDIRNVLSNNQIDKNIEIFWIDFKKIAYSFISKNIYNLH